jgi:hypothetical protein
MTPIEHSDILPCSDRPGEVARLLADEAHREMFGNLRSVLLPKAHHPWNASIEPFEPIDWTWVDMLAHFDLSREACSDSLWLTKMHKCLCPGNEALWDQLRNCLGCPSEYLPSSGGAAETAGPSRGAMAKDDVIELEDHPASEADDEIDLNEYDTSDGDQDHRPASPALQDIHLSPNQSGNYPGHRRHYKSTGGSQGRLCPPGLAEEVPRPYTPCASADDSFDESERIYRARNPPMSGGNRTRRRSAVVGSPPTRTSILDHSSTPSPRPSPSLTQSTSSERIAPYRGFRGFAYTKVAPI